MLGLFGWWWQQQAHDHFPKVGNKKKGRLRKTGYYARNAREIKLRCRRGGSKGVPVELLRYAITNACISKKQETKKGG